MLISSAELTPEPASLDHVRHVVPRGRVRQRRPRTARPRDARKVALDRVPFHLPARARLDSDPLAVGRLEPRHRSVPRGGAGRPDITRAGAIVRTWDRRPGRAGRTRHLVLQQLGIRESQGLLRGGAQHPTRCKYSSVSKPLSIGSEEADASLTNAPRTSFSGIASARLWPTQDIRKTPSKRTGKRSTSARRSLARSTTSASRASISGATTKRPNTCSRRCRVR